MAKEVWSTFPLSSHVTSMAFPPFFPGRQKWPSSGLIQVSTFQGYSEDGWRETPALCYQGSALTEDVPEIEFGRMLI